MPNKLTAKERNMIAREMSKGNEEVETKTKIWSFIALILIFAGMALAAYFVFYLLGAQGMAVPQTTP